MRPKAPSWLGWTAMIVPAVLVIAFVAISTKPPLHSSAPAIALAVAPPDGGLWRIADPRGALTAQLRKQFPPGTPVTKMRGILETEGFVLDPERVRCKPSQTGNQLVCWTPPHPERRMTYAWGGDICTDAIMVLWNEDPGGRITSVSPEYRAGCR